MAERRLSGPARRIVTLLAGHPDGLSLAELDDYARTRFRGLPAARVAALAREAIAAGAVTDDHGHLRATALADDPLHTSQGSGPASDRTADRPLRAVIIDLESVVRTTATEPYTDKRIYQIGAVRAGADRAWVAAATPFTYWLELPDDEWIIISDRVRAEHAAHAVSPAEALAALLAFSDGADVVVAYNGFAADFPLLAEACDREGLQRLPGEYVDAYYLTLAVWPTAPTHRLAHLAAAVGVPTGDLTWHDATADCVLLDRLLAAAAAELRAWQEALRDLIASTVPDSPGWRLLRELAASGLPVEQERPHRHGDIAAVVQAELAGHRPRRATTGRTGPGSLAVGADLRGPDGRVDPGALAQVMYGAATRRPAQEQMTTALHRWADDGCPGLIEAPTGTGKSLAVLAAVLHWLAHSPGRTAIVTTFTKQLQAQLACDVSALDAAVPGLLAATDVVKGGSTRLSLRALLVTLADASVIGARGARNRFLDRLAFRELLVFLLLRLLAATEQVDGWGARSVDPVDLPAFFADHAGPALPVWLASLSQASNGEYEATAATPVAAYTDTASEALAGHRLILANHALLLAHLGELGGLGDDTLLVVDEAHQLEDAATSALTTTLDYSAIEDLFAELGGWLDENHGPAEWAAVAGAVRNLGILLDHEQLPKVAGQAFDARSAGVGVLIGSRAVTLASPYVGTAGVPQVRTLAALLTRLGAVCRAVTGALGAFLAANGTTMDFFAAERLHALIAKTGAIEAAAVAIVADIDDILGPPQWQARRSTRQPGLVTPTADTGAADAGGSATVGDDDGGASVGDEDDDDDVSVTDEDLDADELEAAGVPDPDADSGGAATAQATAVSVGLTNRVVYAEEIEALRAGLRRYRFRVATSPIELPADPTWRLFLTAFTRTYYMSATLRVAGEWTFLRDRLGIDPGVPTLVLGTPFDLANQAELVCFSDFPSWAEQSDGAMRTAAHQLAGYATEVIRPVFAPGMEQQPGERGGFDGGAMVLTTARSTAGGIADYLAAELRRRADETRVHSALIVGNQRAVQAFTDHENGGGLLVGTKGLWQGVDVADANRVRLVWINKLPFAPFAAPIIEARREAVKVRAELAGAEDPDAVATETYYLPLAALQLRQAVGRLIRSERHRGVIVISDRKLAGVTALRRAYRQTFLGSLDTGLLRPDPDTGESTGGNVTTMAEGWRRIWAFFARHGLLDPDRAAELSTDDALEAHTLLPQTRRIRSLALTPARSTSCAPPAGSPTRSPSAPRRSQGFCICPMIRQSLRPASSP